MIDLIERQKAIDAIFSEPLYKSGMKKRDADVVVPVIYEKIKSLPSAQPVDKDMNVPCTDTISRKAAIDAIEKNAYRHTYLDQIIDIIKALPTAQSESEPIDPNERDIEILSALRSNYCCFDEKEERVYHALSEAIKAINALEQPEKVDTPTCEDAVSRQAAIDDFTKWKYQLADCFGEDYSGVSIVE